jgi:methyltransferase (TIGR00027 family)
MQEAIPSRTALSVALRRAAHQVYDPLPRVLDDPIAVKILGQEYAESLSKSATKLHKPFSVAMRAFLIARSRYAEDNLAEAIERGVSQYVLLGAGLDTFAHRNPHPHLHVFEVDHPATQAWKHQLLTRSQLPMPQSLTFVPVDFERESLTERLEATGFDPTARTLFAWLGVVPYLSLEAFRSTLTFIAARPKGSGVIFDYGQPRSALPPNEQLARDSLSARVEQAGEPFQLFFTPEEAVRELAAFSLIEDLGTPELNARYFPNRTDHLKLRGSSGRILSAWL